MERWVKTYGIRHKNNTLNDIVLPGTINSSQYELIDSIEKRIEKAEEISKIIRGG